MGLWDKLAGLVLGPEQDPDAVPDEDGTPWGDPHDGGNTGVETDGV